MQYNYQGSPGFFHPFMPPHMMFNHNGLNNFRYALPTPSPPLQNTFDYGNRFNSVPIGENLDDYSPTTSLPFPQAQSFLHPYPFLNATNFQYGPPRL